MPLRRASVIRSGVLLFIPLLSFALSGCSNDLPQTMLIPRTESATAVYRLFEPIFWMAVAVFVVVEALLVYSAFRFRAHADVRGIPEQLHGNTALEIGWTIAPAVILGIIFLMTAQTLAAVSTPPAAGKEINVNVFGHQWWWEFQYPDLKSDEGKPLVTASDMHVPAGTTVRYTLQSVDVIHSFWVPQLNGKTDLIPGHVNRGFFKADAPGEFFGQCAEFCGAEHAQMRFKVFMDSENDFQAWVKNQQALPAEATGLAKQGADLFAKSSCIGCHTIAGTKAVGLVGPNLTHFASRSSIAAGALPNTPENLNKWLHNPEAVKAGSDMGVAMANTIDGWGADSDKNIDMLIAYLESLK
jgi:cytochrome c oxidase subunit 2